MSLSDRLAEVLPENARFNFYHISTPPSKCASIFSAPPGKKPDRTYCESHFLNISIRPGDGKSSAEILVLAIEVLIYSTKHLTTIFVSKADSTGYLSLLSIPRSQGSPLRAIATTFISYLVDNRQRQDVRLVVSLFARASDQYLFPGSVKNSSKHVSDDRQLVKWWCRVLDPVLRRHAPEDEPQQTEGGDSTTSQAYLVVPGEDSILSFLPQDVRLDPSLRKRWKHGHPLAKITPTLGAPPRCLIPHFPDDPKARFLDELDDEIPDATGSSITESPSKRGMGQWRSVRSLEQFWETMAFRQECSSGRLVGFLWVVFTPSSFYANPVQSLDDWETCSVVMPALLKEESSNLGTATSPSRAAKTTLPRKPSSQRRKQLSGPIVPRMPRIKSTSSNLSVMSNQPAESKYYIWPPSSRGEIVLDEKNYKKAMEILLGLEFAKQEIAEASTRTWIDELAVLAGKEEGGWGQTVIGRKTVLAAAAVTNTTTLNGNTVNTLQVKRKAEGEPPVDTTGINTLGMGLVRKKPKKIQPEPASAVQNHSIGNESSITSGINVLGAGLVRKKPKAS